jgi:hypothetical protein
LGLVGYVAPLPGTSLLEVPSSSAGSALVGRLVASPHASWSKGPSSPLFLNQTRSIVSDIILVLNQTDVTNFTDFFTGFGANQLMSPDVLIYEFC